VADGTVFLTFVAQTHLAITVSGTHRSRAKGDVGKNHQLLKFIIVVVWFDMIVMELKMDESCI